MTERIQQSFRQAAAAQRAAFIPYLTAGFPSEQDFITEAQGLLEVADVLEIGLPYSDPLGDGPTIQQSSQQVLDQGMTVAKTFDLISQLRQLSDKPLVLMTYYNPIYCYPGGEEGFLKALKEAGADGLILPDLPPDEAETLIQHARALELATIFLLAPTSTDQRIALVTEACRGFVYAVSVTGVTGARASLPQDVPDLVRRIKAQTELPVAIGFGVANAETAQRIAQVADGVVVGSALIKAIAEGQSARQLAQDIASGCHKLRQNLA